MDMMSPTVALTRGFVKAAAPSRGAQAAAGGALQMRQGFRVGALTLMVRYEDGSELTEMPPLHRLPNTPAWLLGVANLHGLLVPVFDLGVWAGVTRPVDTRRMLLVLSHGPDAAGVVIDGLPQRLRFNENQQADAATAPARLAPHVRGAALIDGVLWFDIDRAALLDAFENSLGGPSSTGN
jgi:purine-binding chemotaxis protein CheW